MLPASVVLFAIQSALRLGVQARDAYVDATRRRALVLPLPDFQPEISEGAIRSFFEERRERFTEQPELAGFVGKLIARRALSDPEMRRLRAVYEEVLIQEFVEDNGEEPQLDQTQAFPADAVAALVRVRQWTREDDPTVSTLQRIGGTLVEVAVGYFATVPGQFNMESRTGRALHALFSGLDDINVTEDPLGTLPQRLFFAVLDTISAQPEIVAEDPSLQELIRVASMGIVEDVSLRIETIRRETPSGNIDAEEGVRSWAEIVFRSVLSSAGRLVAENPGRFLGTSDEGRRELVTNVAGALLDLVLEQPQGGLRGAISRDSLDRLAKAALEATAQHPELISTRTGLRKLIAEISSKLAKFDVIFGGSMLPVLGRMVIERTAVNLPLIWPDAENKPGEHLLLVASEKTLLILATDVGPDAPGWQVRFGEAEVLAIVETVLNEIAANPGWIVDATADVDAHLGVALEAMVKVLRNRGNDATFTGQTGARLIQTGIRAAALRAEFVDNIPNGPPFVAAVLDVVLGRVFDDELPEEQTRRVRWRLLRSETLEALVDVSLAQLSRHTLPPERLEVLNIVLASGIDKIRNGKSWDIADFERELAGALVAE